MPDTVTSGNELVTLTNENSLIVSRQQAAFQKNSDSYNGAIRDNYSWSQSIQDLDVHVKVNILSLIDLSM